MTTFDTGASFDPESGLLEVEGHQYHLEGDFALPEEIAPESLNEREASALAQWTTAQEEARSWPIYLRYAGWDRKNCAVFHPQFLLEMYRKQLVLMGQQLFPKIVQQWWPIVPSLPLGLLVGVLAVHTGGTYIDVVGDDGVSIVDQVYLPGREIIEGHPWVDQILSGLGIAAVITLSLSMGMLPEKWYQRLYAQVVVIARRRDPSTGHLYITQAGRLPLPRLAFIAVGGDHYAGTARNAGIFNSVIVLDAGERDLRTLRPADLFGLPAAKAKYIGTNARAARSLMELASKAGELYLETQAKSGMMNPKLIGLGLLVILAVIAGFNIMTGGGGLDVEQIRNAMGQGGVSTE